LTFQRTARLTPDMSFTHRSCYYGPPQLWKLSAAKFIWRTT
jgi:hypothetical protein